MPLTLFTQMLAKHLLEQQAEDPSYSKARMAKNAGADRSLLGRWLSGEVDPPKDRQIEVLCRLGILGTETGFDERNAKVIGRLDPNGGRVEMIEQLHEPSIPIPYLEYLLNAGPLWARTKGDPFMLCLDGLLPGYEMASKVVARRPADASLLDIPPGSLAIVRLAHLEKTKEDGIEIERVDWRWMCVRIHQVSHSRPFLEYSKIGTMSTPYCIMMPNCFEIMGLLLSLPSPEHLAVGS